jgi:hypothetical protein
MKMPEQFDTIRPYQDHEVKPAIERLVSHPLYPPLVKYLYGDADIDTLTAKFRSIETIHDFQHFFSKYTVGRIIEKSSRGLTARGTENIDPQISYLFVANHRDIVLDTAIMQWLLDEFGHRSSQITIGENLLTGQFMQDLGKLNKVVTFFRGGSKVEQYRNALTSSAYINYVIKEQKESIWIAHRNGRTKDGNDRTQTGLIKMLSAGNQDICGELAGLNIVPVTISYEIEPCDILKVRELYISKRQEYKKAPDEDFKSVLAGITGEKGRISFAFGKPLNAFILSLKSEHLHASELIDRITGEIDRQIHTDYFLWPGNYLAFDLLHHTDEYREQYSEGEKRSFEAVMQKKIGTLEGFDQDELRRMYLQMYANPVINKRALKQGPS